MKCSRLVIAITSIALFLSVSRVALAQSEPPAAAPDQFKPLFNGKDLTGWYTWLKGHGKDSDPDRIFQVTDGVLHIYKDAKHASTQPFGYVSTIDDYGDCRIRLQYKWGEKRFGTRATKRRDSGLLYFTFGPDGPDGKVWPHSVECQIQENDTGDIFAIGTGCSSTVNPATLKEKAPKFMDSGAGGVGYTTPGKMNDRIIRSQMLETPDWNTVEVILSGDTAVHIVKGKVNMRISRATRPDPNDAAKNISLTTGRIVLQAEGAEILYRNIEIAPLK